MVDIQHPGRVVDEDSSGTTAKVSTIRRKRMARQHNRLYLLLIAFGLLFGPLIVPHAPSVQPLVGYGGVSTSHLAIANPTCGHPKDVFAKLLPDMKYTLPTKAQLEQLPTALPSDQTWSASDATYTPQTDILCAGGWSALYVRFVNP